jgi:hypothetical protein
MTDSPLPVRTALDMLRLEFPHYRITRQVIGDRLFCLAQATGSHVQPQFAQARTPDRLRAKLSVPVKQFNAAEPSIPRVWDVLLGGKDNYAADREQARKLLTVFPQAAELARESRQFQRRAVGHVARAGVRQFLDLGCGLPTSPATHEVAQEAQPGAVVVYADNDEQVMTHARALLAGTPGVLAVAGDLTDPSEILYDWQIRQVLDFRQPIAVVLAMTLHFFNAAAASSITATLAGGLPPGSYLILSVGQLEAETGQQFTGQYQAATLHHHTRQGVAGWLSGLDLIEPGITQAQSWRPPGPVPPGPDLGHIWAAVARTPSLREAARP